MYLEDYVGLDVETPAGDGTVIDFDDEEQLLIIELFDDAEMVRYSPSEVSILDDDVLGDDDLFSDDEFGDEFMAEFGDDEDEE